MQSFSSYGYVDAKYDYLRKPLSGNYYRGEYKIGMNMYSFSKPLRNAIKEGKKEPVPGWGTTTKEIITTFDTIKWAKEAGINYIDPTFYFVPGYDDFAMPSDREKLQIEERALELKKFCHDLGIHIASTGIK
ncbi:MAG: hypothetical protein FWC45_00615, partial [Treponema sp.]|nr:hypothetical protein [Treponema sp.]